MITHLQPWHLAFVWSVGWVNRQQQLAIEYLCAENRTFTSARRQEADPADGRPAKKAGGEGQGAGP